MQKNQAGYAYGQIRLCLADLASSSHGTKAKAVKRFQDYIAQNKPDLNDDDVMYLFAGADAVEGMQGAVSKVGLLHYAGIDSGKHGGQLKRICAPVISLIRYLISLPPFGSDADSEYNMFFEIFVTIPVEELSKINFVKHILGETDKGSLFGGTRSGGAEDALEILSILMRDHRTPGGDPDPIDVTQLLGDSKPCRDRLNQYMQKTNSDVVTKAMLQFKAAQTKAIASKWDDSRPSKWDDDNFKRVPVQEGEEGEVPDADDELQLSIIPDPLGLSELDLRATQKLYASGRLTVPTAGLRPGGGGAGSGAAAGSRTRRHSLGSADDEDDEAAEGRGAALASVLPQDRAFSPSLFLTLIHGGISFDQLQVGSTNLRSQLEQQNSQRENLVRVHFGLFVQCAEGLDWLKAYRRGIYTNQNEEDVRARKAVNLSANDSGEQMLSRAKSALESARHEATGALKPILDRMRTMRKLKTADAVLKRLAPTLEHPHKMKQALSRGDLDEVVAIYTKVQAMPVSTALRVVQGVKDSAEGILEDLKTRCRAAMEAAEPDANVLLRYARIIGQLEGDEAYREQIRSCFAAQLGHFNSFVDSLMARFAEDAMAAYCHARDLRAEAEAEARANSALGRAVTRPTQSQSNLVPAKDWMPEAAAEDETRSASLLSSRARLLGRRRDDDRDARDAHEPWAAHSDDEGTAEGKGEDDEPHSAGGMRLEEVSRENYTLLAGRVRELALSRLVNGLAKWLPCLFRLVHEATSKVAVGGKGLWVAGDAERARNVKLTMNMNRKKAPPAMTMLGSSVLACSEAIRYAIVGMRETDALSSFDNFSSGRDAAFEPHILRQEKMQEAQEAHVFEHESFALPLKDPFLSRCVRDVGDLFDVACALYQDPGQTTAATGGSGGQAMSGAPTSGSGATAAAAVSDARKHSELFLSAISTLRELSRGGEVSIAARAMSRLHDQALLLFENKDRPREAPREKLTPFAALSSSSGLGKLDSLKDDAPEVKTMERAVFDLRALIAKHLQRLARKTRRPEWISQHVRDGLRAIFSTFVANMVGVAALLEGDPDDVRRLVRSNTRSRARTVTASSLQSPKLLKLEADLKQGQISTEAQASYLLDLLRACVVLRTDTMPSLWREAKAAFPLPAEDDDPIPQARELHLFEIKEIPGLDREAQRRVPSVDNLAGLRGASSGGPFGSNNSLSQLGSSDLFNRIMKTVGFEVPEANVNIEEVARLESSTVQRYTTHALAALRAVALAGYSVLTKREEAGAWRETSMRPEGFVVPPHLSRLLLMVGNEKETLAAALGGITVEAGTKGKTATGTANAAATLSRGERYQDSMFRDVCTGFLEAYADVVARVNANALDDGPYSRSSASAALAFKTDLASVLASSTSAQCQHPKSFAQASEELAYLAELVRPHTRSQAQSTLLSRQAPLGAGEECLSGEDLKREAANFAMFLQR